MRSLSSSRWTDIVFTLAPVLLCYLLAKIADNNKGEPRRIAIVSQFVALKSYKY